MSEIGEHPGNPERSERGKRLESKWREELAAADAKEAEAQSSAREQLRNLSSTDLMKIGSKQVLYGYGLSVLHGAGMLLGAAVGAGTGALIGGVGGAVSSSELGPAGAVVGGSFGMIAGSVIGYQAGVEMAGWAYNKFIRKIDTELPKLKTVDWIIGQVPGFNPPIMAGFRHLIDGFFAFVQNKQAAPAPAAVVR